MKQPPVPLHCIVSDSRRSIIRRKGCLEEARCDSHHGVQHVTRSYKLKLHLSSAGSVFVHVRPLFQECCAGEALCIKYRHGYSPSINRNIISWAGFICCIYDFFSRIMKFYKVDCAPCGCQHSRVEEVLLFRLYAAATWFFFLHAIEVCFNKSKQSQIVDEATWSGKGKRNGFKYKTGWQLLQNVH